MDTITLTKTFTYTDTTNNLLFWATTPRPGFTPYEPKLKQLDTSATPDALGNFPIIEVDNPQTLQDFCEQYIVSIINKTLTEPIRQYVVQQTKLQGETLAKQQADEVLARLTVE